MPPCLDDPIRRPARRSGLRWSAAAAALTALLGLAAMSEEPVAVRYPEGIAHGFLVLRTLEGTHLADGDLIQTAHGDQVTSRIILRFADGSTNDETAVFSQRGHFRLLSDHLVQKGPAFPMPMEIAIDAPKGSVTVRYEEKGESKRLSEHLELPADLANGFVATLIKNFAPEAAQSTVSMLAANPKPRIVRLVVSRAGAESFSIGGSPRNAVKYVVKVDLGGVAGVVAPLIGKQPQDTYVWISEGDAPTFVKSEGPFYVGGPSWKLELATPAWPRRGDTGR
jgi:hypothetical protein